MLSKNQTRSEQDETIYLTFNKKSAGTLKVVVKFEKKIQPT
jgi:hypothetical protein